jgi:hypothetical protein
MTREDRRKSDQKRIGRKCTSCWIACQNDHRKGTCKSTWTSVTNASGKERPKYEYIMNGIKLSITDEKKKYDCKSPKI